jgi:hypothetical protein
MMKAFVCYYELAQKAMSAGLKNKKKINFNKLKILTKNELLKLRKMKF